MYDRITRIWTVEPGDTLSKIALQIYGDWQKYPIIFNANSDLVKDEDLIYPGWKLYIPTPEQKERRTTSIIDSDHAGDFLVRVNDKDLQFASSITVKSALNSGARTGGFTIPFEANENAKKGDPVQIFVKNELLLDGRLIYPATQYTKANGNTVTWQVSTLAYEIINSQYKTTTEKPGEWTNISLGDLVNDVLSGHSVSVVFADQSFKSQTFKKIGIGDDEPIFDFLVSVFSQKGLLLQGLPNGDLLATKSVQSNVAPVGSFSNANDIAVSYNYEGLAKEYRAVSQKTAKGGAKTATNSFITDNIFRQVNKDRGFDGDLQSFADYVQAREFSKALEIVVQTRDLKNNIGALWKPNQLITIENNVIGFDSEKLFLIKSVDYNLSREGFFATLYCVLPETMRGEMPEELPFL